MNGQVELAATVDVLKKGQADLMNGQVELAATVDVLKKGQADLMKGQAELKGMTSQFIVANSIKNRYGQRFSESLTVAGPDDFVSTFVQSGMVDKTLIGVLTKALEANVLAQVHQSIGPALCFAFPQPQCLMQ